MAVLEESASAEYLPDEATVRSAGQLQDIIVGQMRDGESVSLSFGNDEGGTEAVKLSPALAKAFLELLQLVSSGKGSQVIPADAHFSTEEAAYMLCVRHSYVLKLLDDGTLPYFKQGPIHCIPAQELFAYREKDRAEKERLLKELARSTQEHGLL